jgi:hypothetical protein
MYGLDAALAALSQGQDFSYDTSIGSFTLGDEGEDPFFNRASGFTTGDNNIDGDFTVELDDLLADMTRESSSFHASSYINDVMSKGTRKTNNPTLQQGTIITGKTTTCFC